MHFQYQIGKKLRGNKYTNAYILPNSLKSALIPFFAKIKTRTGWKGEYRFGLINDIRKRDVIAYPLMAQQIAALGLDPHETIKDFPLPQLVSDQENFLIYELGQYA